MATGGRVRADNACKASGATLPARDALVGTAQRDELDQRQQSLAVVRAELLPVYRACPDAQRVEAACGIGSVAAVSIVARLGPVQRFAAAAQLIAYAGLAPGLQESERRRREGRIGGGGTDQQRRPSWREASVWARPMPRSRATYERTAKRRGKKRGRSVGARRRLRSIYQVWRAGVAFEPGAAAAKALKRLKREQRFPNVRWIRVPSCVRPRRAPTRLPKQRPARSPTIIGPNRGQGS
ncbi:MAG: transposase [Planctomycetes bacterium]|nr:transposase [Planctomycetota bacterium]